METFQELKDAARVACEGADPAHDYQHVLRVAENARRICDAERADASIAVPAALLHELFNLPKNHPDSSLSGERCADLAEALLREQKWPEQKITAVGYCIRVHGFSRGITPDTLEARVLQDADRLDAIGAIGIARLFSTCASMKRPFYSVDDPFCQSRTPDDQAFGVDHFYKKLLKIPERLHTGTARAMAAERSAFIKTYLDQLAREISW
jgi:uncharacterized protein